MPFILHRLSSLHSREVLTDVVQARQRKGGCLSCHHLPCSITAFSDCISFSMLLMSLYSGIPYSGIIMV